MCIRDSSYWTKNYRTGIEMTDSEALERRYEYWDPIDTLPAAGQDWWRTHGGDPAAAHATALAAATSSRQTAAAQGAEVPADAR